MHREGPRALFLSPHPPLFSLSLTRSLFLSLLCHWLALSHLLTRSLTHTLTHTLSLSLAHTLTKKTQELEERVGEMHIEKERIG